MTLKKAFREIINDLQSNIIFKESLKKECIVLTDNKLNTIDVFSRSSLLNNIENFDSKSIGNNAIYICNKIKINTYVNGNEHENNTLKKFNSCAVIIKNRHDKTLGYLGLFSIKKEVEYPMFFLETLSKLVLCNLNDNCNLNNLTKREEEILSLMSLKTDIEISQLLHISLSTVRTHIYNILKKSECHTRYELLRKVSL